MNRLVIGGIAATLIGLGTAGKANAQIVYGYSVPNAGGIANGTTVVGPGAYQTYNTYYSPFTGVMQRQTYYTDVFGNSFARSSVYNPYLNLGYRTGYFQPNPYLYPLGGYNYGYYTRRW